MTENKTPARTIRFTPEQEAVMGHSDPQILVSAAAGSGKTHVMTHHVADRIRRRIFDVSQVIVLTFTRDAASQMRDRIARVLDDALEQEADEAMRRYLQSQIDRLPAAKIMTIDAFCLDLVRQFAWDLTDADGELILSGNERMLDENESKLLLRQAVEEVLDSAYIVGGASLPSLSGELNEETAPEELPWPGYNAEDFAQLSDAYGGNRDDRSLVDLVISLYGELRAMPDYRSFLEETIAALPEVCETWPDNPQGEILFDHYHLRLDRAQEGLLEAELRLEAASDQFYANAERSAEVAGSFAIYHQGVRDLHALRTEYTAGTLSGRAYWGEIRAVKDRLPELLLPRRSKKKPEIGEYLDIFAAYIHELFQCLDGRGASSKALTDHHQLAPLILFELDVETIQAQLQAMLPALEQLSGFLLAVDTAYAEQKRREHSMDFGDDAHLALELLRGERAGSYIREHYRALYIDEYQDTSYLQEAILDALDTEHSFRVGDVKQSIYRFRHARPEIFLKREEAYEQDGSGAMLRMSYNFRSTAGILAVVNYAFSRLMHPAISQLDYRADHMLHPPEGSQSIEGPDVQVSLLFEASTTDAEKAEYQETRTALLEQHAAYLGRDSEEVARHVDEQLRDRQWDPEAATEAYYVASQIRALHEEGVPYAEIAVMARSWSVLGELEPVLLQMGIPTSQAEKEMALESYEIRLMVSFLQLLDNARQDIPLVTVLLSPLLGTPFLEEELARIRIWSQAEALEADEYHPDWHLPTPFFVAWEAFAEAETVEPALQGLQARARKIRAELQRWRVRERTSCLGDLVQELLQISGFTRLLADLPDREIRLTRVRGFQVWCERFDSPTKQGVHALIRQLEAIETHELAAPWMEEAEQDEQVKLLTFHGSKGLEFPYVFLIGLQKNYNFDRNKMPVRLDQDLGLGYEIRLDEGRIKMTSVLEQALALKANDLDLAEELNLLYVAMTRAERKLYLVGRLRRVKDGLNAKASRFLELRDGRDPELSAIKSLRSNLDAIFLAFADEASFRHLKIGELMEDPGVLSLLPETVSPVIARESSDLLSCELINLRQLSLNRMSEAVGEILGTRPQAELERREEDPAEPSLTDREALALRGEWLRSDQPRRPYPAQLATQTPLKFTVTELKRRADLDAEGLDDEPEVRDHSGALTTGTPQLGASGIATLLRSVGEPDAYAPQDLYARDLSEQLQSIQSSGTDLDPRERGIALHSFMQFAPWDVLAEDASPEAFEQAIQRLVSDGVLLSNESAAVQAAIPSLQAFAASDLLTSILNAEQGEGQAAVFRELPFTLMLPLGELFPELGEDAARERCFVQGMMDLWYETEDELVLVDYKSDRIRGDDAAVAAELSKRYALQLQLYSRALQAARGRPVDRCVIWSIPRGQCYTIEHV